MAASFDLCPSDGAGPHHDDPTVATAVSANTGRMRIRGNVRLLEWMLVFLRRCERCRLAGTRQRKTRRHSRKVARRELGLDYALHRGFQDRGEAVLDPEADVGRAGAPLA